MASPLGHELKLGVFSLEFGAPATPGPNCKMLKNICRGGEDETLQVTSGQWQVVAINPKVHETPTIRGHAHLLYKNTRSLL